MNLKYAAFLLSIAAALSCGTSKPVARGPSGPPVRGSLDKKVIKDVIREHHREVRACYEVELVKQPDLSGRVLSQFTISPTGNVVAVVLRDSTVSNPSIEQCLRRHLFTWKFPKPVGGGNVDVIYAFNFIPTP
jgi:hypothetical protein